MDKPVALTNEQLAYCRKCLANHWPWTEHKHSLIASLVAMAEERNRLLADRAEADKEKIAAALSAGML